MKLKELKLHERNPRKITPEKLEKLTRSITDLPQMMELRPIIVDENNIILGGNMRYRALKKLGYKEIPDEWVKRADQLTEEQKREFIVKDNVGFGDWEMDILKSDYELEELADWGLDLSIDEVYTEDEEEEKVYTQLIKAPIYEIKGEKPKIKELCDTSKYDKLIDEINKLSISEDEKKFLRLAASRHLKFDYGACAEFYAHTEGDVRDQFEKSALVIIDFNKAIECGFVKMVKDLIHEYDEESR